MAHEGQPSRRPTSATPTLLHEQDQVTFSKVHSATSAPRAASFPGRVGPSLRRVSLLFMFLAYLVGGAPRAASSPSRSGLTQWRLLFPHLSKWICSFMTGLLEIIACSIDTYLWSRSLWPGACAWVRPCNVDKSEWSSSGRGSPARRYLTRPLVPQSLHRSNQWLAGNRNGSPCFPRVGVQDPPKE